MVIVANKFHETVHQYGCQPTSLGTFSIVNLFVPFI